MGGGGGGQDFEPLKSEQLRNVESPCRGREYFVRWEGKAYWHCTWLVPYLLQKKSPTKLNNFVVSYFFLSFESWVELVGSLCPCLRVFMASFPTKRAKMGRMKL